MNNHATNQLRPGHVLPVLPPLLVLGVFAVAQVMENPGHQRLVLSKGVYAEGVCFGDVDGDGTKDFVAGPFYYRGPGLQERVRFRPGEAVPARGYDHDCFQSWVVDVDRNGHPDILQVSLDQGFSVHLYLQPATPSEDWPHHVIATGVGSESPEMADVTGDGLPELVALSKGRLGFFRINREEPGSPWPFHPVSKKRSPFPFYHGLGIGDLNGDGRVDLVEKEGWYEAPANRLEDAWTFHPHQFSPQGGAQMLVYDVDGDGDNDIVTSLWAHGWGLAWFESEHDGEAITFRKHELMPGEDKPGVGGISFSQHHALEKGDFNGDGLMDFATGKRYWAHDGRDPGADGPAVLYWFELKRDEGGVTFIPHLLDDDSGVGTQVAVADLNGDGRADLGIGNKKGVYAYLSAK